MNSVLDRTELQASPLADLHTLANELGIDGYRLLRREQLVEAILTGEIIELPAARASVSARTERGGASERSEQAPARRRRSGRGDGVAGTATTARAERSSSAQLSEREPAGPGTPEPNGGRGNQVIEGVVAMRDGGGAMLRVNPPGSSEDDAYISPAQVKRCELSEGDRVSGPMRRRRRSERHPALLRIETINGLPADEAVKNPPQQQPEPQEAQEVAEERTPRARQSRSRRAGTAASAAATTAGRAAAERGPAFPSEVIELPGSDSLLADLKSLAPLGFGSRAVICGPSRAGKSELLARLLSVLAGRDDLDLQLLLLGVRPEELSDWESGPLKPVAAHTFAASGQDCAEDLKAALQRAERSCMAGRRAVLLIDTLDGLPAEEARRALAQARNERGAGSLTIIATAEQPLGGETTVIALIGGGTGPAIDVQASGTLKPEQMLGASGAAALERARAARSRRRGGLFGFLRGH